MVARTRYSLPLSPSLERKFAALRELFELRVLATSADGSPYGDDTFTLVGRQRVADGAAFWLALAPRIRRLAAEHRPDIVVAQSPFEGAAAVAAGVRDDLVIELHGDWRTFGRLYGSRLRRPLAHVLDDVGTWALRRAAKVRAVSPYTARLAREVGVEPADVFPAYMDFAPFLGPLQPPPGASRVLFVGVLERYKNVDGLEAAWRQVVREVPDARLHVVGRGSLAAPVQRLVRDGLATWATRLPPEGVAQSLDGSDLLVLPSRSEGMGRVVIEALLRGRPVVGAKVGGIPDLVDDGVNGLLAAPDPSAVAAALVRVLTDDDLRARLTAHARPSAEQWVVGPEEYASRLRLLVPSARPYTGAR